jgi:hypothetical protein
VRRQYAPVLGGGGGGGGGGCALVTATLATTRIESRVNTCFFITIYSLRIRAAE